MQNHRPACSKRKRVHMRWTPPYTAIQRTMAPPPAGPCLMKVRGIGLSDPCRLDDHPDPAADPVSVGRHPAAAGRAFARRHPAADPDAGCPAAAGSASVGSGCSCAFSSRVDGANPRGQPPWRQRMEPQKVAAQNGQCACENSAISTPISAKISPRTESGSHPLVSTIVVDERGTAGPEAHRFDRAEEYVVAAHRSYLDDAAIERDHGRGEYGAAGRERQPISAGKSLAACNPGAAREYVGDLRAAISQRVDAKHAILHHDRIGLAAAIEAHEQHGRRVRNRTNRGCRRAGLAAGTGGGDHVNGRAEAAHPLAEERGLDRAHWIGPHRREGAVHRIIWPLVDPAHCAYSAARLTTAGPG